MSREAPLLSSLTERLRGVYRLGVNDGAGLLNGSDTFTRQFETPPIQHEAADRIEALEADASRYRFLRDRDAGPDGSPPPAGLFIGQVPENLILTDDEADAAIDAALGPNHDGRGEGRSGEREAGRDAEVIMRLSAKMIRSATSCAVVQHDGVWIRQEDLRALDDVARSLEAGGR